MTDDYQNISDIYHQITGHKYYTNLDGTQDILVNAIQDLINQSSQLTLFEIIKEYRQIMKPFRMIHKIFKKNAKVFKKTRI